MKHRAFPVAIISLVLLLALTGCMADTPTPIGAGNIIQSVATQEEAVPAPTAQETPADLATAEPTLTPTAEATTQPTPDEVEVTEETATDQSATPDQALRFEVSISEQRCWLYRDEKIIAEWTCSTGRPSSPTEPGEYEVQSKLIKAYGSTWDIWMPFWLGIYWAGDSENGIHGLPWDASTGAETWTGLVGTQITYGCVMLDNANAQTLYDMAYIGMPVIIKP